MNRVLSIRIAKLLWISSSIALILFAASPWHAQGEGNVIRFVRNPDTAPDFKLDTLDGKPLSLSDWHGKVILLNFWATWCGACRAEIPDLIELQKKYQDRLQIIGLAFEDEDLADLKKVVAKTGINYPVAIAPFDVRMKYGGVAGLAPPFML